MKIGKLIGRTRYFHKSVLNIPNQFSQEEMDMITAGLGMIKGFEYTIISLDKINNQISFTNCPTFDKVFEPSLGASIRVYLNNGITKLNKETPNNPLIYHRRYLFVGSDYNGFNIEQDIKRVNKWSKYSPDKNKMGRRKYWDEFCTNNGI